jgi:hypothetical protein
MKTQLIEDLGESGSVPAEPVRARPLAPPQTAASPTEPAIAPIVEPAPLAQALPPDTAASDDSADWLAELMALEAELQSTPALAAAPEPEPANTPPEPERKIPPTVEPELRKPPAPEPGLRREPALGGELPSASAPWPEPDSPPAPETGNWTRPQRSNFVKRRVAAWGAAAVLLGLLVSGGLWLQRESHVDGAMAVLASTKPVPAPAARSSPAAAAPAVPAGARPEPSNGREVEAVGGTAGGSTAAGPAEAPALATTAARAVDNGTGDTPASAVPENQPPVVNDAPKHKPARMLARVRKHARAEPDDGVLEDSEPSSRQRFEETLLQCRAHGYREHECLERGCQMTRYGFVCKG